MSTRWRPKRASDRLLSAGVTSELQSPPLKRTDHSGRFLNIHHFIFKIAFLFRSFCIFQSKDKYFKFSKMSVFGISLKFAIEQKGEIF